MIMSVTRYDVTRYVFPNLIVNKGDLKVARVSEADKDNNVNNYISIL